MGPGLATSCRPAGLADSLTRAIGGILSIAVELISEEPGPIQASDDRDELAARPSRLPRRSSSAGRAGRLSTWGRSGDTGNYSSSWPAHVKVRYKQTMLGASWAVLQPLTMMVAFTIFFSRMARMSSGDLPYPLFALSGLLPWLFFATAMTSAGNSVVGSGTTDHQGLFPEAPDPVLGGRGGRRGLRDLAGLDGLDDGLLPGLARPACCWPRRSSV